MGEEVGGVEGEAVDFDGAVGAEPGVGCVGGVGGGGRVQFVDFFAHDGEGGPAVHGPGSVGWGVGVLAWEEGGCVGGGWGWGGGGREGEREGGREGGETHMPHMAIRVVAKRKEWDIGARIMDAPNMTCERPQAVVMSGW